ncbi:acetylxylan esterase [Isosphaeraceae bacterium EP7]
MTLSTNPDPHGPRNHTMLAQACFALALIAAPAPADTEAPLPDPLVKLDGRRVADRDEWVKVRRPELKRLFEERMYGKAPDAPDNLKAAVIRVDREYLGGKATLKEVSISYGPAGTPPIGMLLIIPNHRKGPAPAFVGLNFAGNHCAVADPKVALPTTWMPASSPGVKDNRATEAGRGKQVDTWPVETIIDRGYALATAYCGDIAPDHPGHADGVHPHYPGHDWGTVAAWAWGLSRMADALALDPDVDSSKLAVVGHSRLGKAALVAGAFDPRFAAVIPHQAGCGGTAPSRGTVGESVKRINTVFPHWFNDAFKTYNDDPSRLPFDQNALAALVAPRPLLFSNAVEDTWANPEGQFRVLKAAEPAYALMGAGGLNAASMPEVNHLVDSTLGYVIRPGKHSMSPPDWVFFLDFADRNLGKPGAAR